MHNWLALMENLAAAAWNPDRALLRRGGADLARYLVLGVPSAANSLFAGAGTTLVSTHDRERIIALRTVYGGSLTPSSPSSSGSEPTAAWHPSSRRTSFAGSSAPRTAACRCSPWG